MKDDDLGKLKIEAANKRFSEQLAEDIAEDQVRKRKADEKANEDVQMDENTKIEDPEDQAGEMGDQEEMPTKKARTDCENMGPQMVLMIKLLRAINLCS